MDTSVNIEQVNMADLAQALNTWHLVISKPLYFICYSNMVEIYSSSCDFGFVYYKFKNYDRRKSLFLIWKGIYLNTDISVNIE